MQWEHAASGTDTRMLFLNARDDAAQVLADFVEDDVRALAVAPLTLVLVAGEAILNMTISGTPADPVITVELWPTRLPTVKVKMVERLENSEAPNSPRQRIWTFSSADTHRSPSRTAGWRLRSPTSRSAPNLLG
jgi:hypothetical protein